MEVTKQEISVIEALQHEIQERSITDLADLQLALVGGGIADTMPH